MTNFVLSAQAQKWEKKVPWKTLHTNIDRSLSACTFILTYPLIARVIGASKMISQPVSSIFLCPPRVGELQACPFPDVISPPLLLSAVFSPLSQCPARWFWPDLMNGKHVHTTQFASLYDGQKVFILSNCLLDLGMDFLVGSMVFIWDA